MSNWKTLRNKFFSSSFFVFFIFLIDRISKILIIKKSEELGNGEIYSSKFMNFELIWNKGIAFGLFSFDESLAYQTISVLIFVVIIILIYFIKKSESYEKFGFIMVLGGALGNLFDRLFYKAVPDFIELHVNSFHWFIFNIADIFITIGVICLILVEVFYKKEV